MIFFGCKGTKIAGYAQILQIPARKFASFCIFLYFCGTLTEDKSKIMFFNIKNTLKIYET